MMTMVVVVMGVIAVKILNWGLPLSLFPFSPFLVIVYEQLLQGSDAFMDPCRWNIGVSWPVWPPRRWRLLWWWYKSLTRRCYMLPSVNIPIPHLTKTLNAKLTDVAQYKAYYKSQCRPTHCIKK